MDVIWIVVFEKKKFYQISYRTYRTISQDVVESHAARINVAGFYKHSVQVKSVDKEPEEYTQSEVVKKYWHHFTR